MENDGASTQSPLIPIEAEAEQAKKTPKKDSEEDFNKDPKKVS